MSLPLNIAVNMQDTQNLGTWPGFVTQIPPLFQGSVKDIVLIGITPSGGALTGAAFTQINLAGYSCQVTITALPRGDGTQTVYVPTTILTPVVVGGLTQFVGSLDFRGNNIPTAMAAADQLAAFIEVEFVLAGIRQPAFQGPLTILAPADSGAVVNPTPVQSYYTSAQANAQFVPFVGAPGIGFILTSKAGKKVFIFAQDDGSLGNQALN